ncbi:MAG: DUF1854 domain-containing protein [Clostridia bacterium]|nr:DUF1854 domain-containing protein [Clostridia bacterium]
MSNRIFVTENDKITVNENNLVNLTLQSGEVFEKLEPRRLFPVNRIDEYVTLLDEEGKEIAVIRKICELDPVSRQIIQNSLDDYYLVPHITRINSITEKNGKIHWIVETDRGYKEFDIRNRNHDVRVYSDGRVRVRDSDDNRYIIEDYRKLDKHSKRQAAADL